MKPRITPAMHRLLNRLTIEPQRISGPATMTARSLYEYGYAQFHSNGEYSITHAGTRRRDELNANQ